MTPQKARDIVLAINPIQSESDYIFCKGFLAGIEYEREAVKGLVKAAEFGIYQLDSEHLGIQDALIDSLAAYKARMEGK